MARWREKEIPPGGFTLEEVCTPQTRPEDPRETLFWRCACGEEFNLAAPREAACPHGIVRPDGTVIDPEGYEPGEQPE